MDSLFGERSTCEGTRHVAGNEWMVGRRENHVDQKRMRWKSDTRQWEKGGKGYYMTGEGPTLVKHRATKKGGTARASLIRAL